MPVELKTGKNTKRDPRFQDKIQAACYALILEERNGEAPDTGTLLYTKNAAVERTEETGDLSPAKEFSINGGLLNFVVRTRNEIAAMEYDASVPTGFEADARCEYCFEQDTCMVVSGRLDQESKAGKIGSAIPDEEREYFDRFYQAIEQERRAVHREYAKLWDQTPQERADDDRALVDLEPAGQTQLDDGQWELRANGTTAVSKIRDGDLALASDGNPITGAAEICRIARLDEDQIVVTADEPVELRRLDVYPPKSAPTECSRRSTTPSSPGRQSRKTSSSVAATPCSKRYPRPSSTTTTPRTRPSNWPSARRTSHSSTVRRGPARRTPSRKSSVPV